ncbi:MAG: hypothetical protein HY259_06695 [Chloroflexi bacterium]|nr:hypothetical protein [Chloroflexota bacterium]MBI3733131.1 hypothetical protein [Chloroflexota bacterium]
MIANSITWSRQTAKSTAKEKIIAEANIESHSQPQAFSVLVRPHGHVEIIEIDPEQSWYWSDEWQAAEREADEDLRSGRYSDFNSIDKLIASLKSSMEA